MKTKNRKIVVMFAMVLCFCVVSMLGTTVSASVSLKVMNVPASIGEAIENGLIGPHWYAISVPGCSKEELPTAKGDQVTNDDIVKVACYLANCGFSYNLPGTTVGTCTGYVMRVLRYLEVNKEIVTNDLTADGRDGGWDRFYTLETWDKPGQGSPKFPTPSSPYGPSYLKSTICPKLARNSEIEFITTIPVGSTQEDINSSGIKPGDLLVSDTHVAFAYQDDKGNILTLGAASDGASYDPICAMTFTSLPDSKKGPIDVYRIAKLEIKGKITITKYQAATSVTDRKTLAGVQFTATSKDDPTRVYTSTISGEDGVCTFEDVLGGKYTISETMYPENVLKADDFEAEITKNGQELTYNVDDVPKTIDITVRKKYTPETKGKTDAKLTATFSIYSDEACTQFVTSFETNAEGEGTCKSLPTGKYWMKETVFPEGMNPDASNPDSGKTYRDTVYVIEGNAASQIAPIEYRVVEVLNHPITGKVKVKKQENSGNGTQVSPAKGAILKLTLESSIGTDHEVSYTDTVDEKGECEFECIELKKNGNDATIPYGRYILSEVKESDDGEHYFYYIQEQPVDVQIQNKTYSSVVSDDVVPFYPEIRKSDADTNQEVHMAGFKYKIWQLANEELGFKAGWVSQFDATTDSTIDEFVTDENGIVVLPDKLRAGKYVFYEVDCPEGYYIPEKYRLPANEADYGNSGVSGVEVDVTKSILYIPENQVATQKDIYLLVPMKDPQLKGQIKLYKTGEVLSDVTIKNEAITGEEIYSPKYENKPLEGISFKVYANEDIYSPDKRIKLHSKGEYIETITTESDGYANSNPLYLGEYRLEEVPEKGYKTCEDIIVRLENEDKYNEIKVTPVTAENVRQKLYVKIKKIFEDSKYNDIDLSDKSAIFTVRAKEPIMNYQGNVIIPANTLVSVIEFKDNHQISEDVNLPAGTYEIEEIYASEPYERITEKRTVVLQGDTTGETQVDFEEEFINDYITKDVYFIKFSASNFADADATGLVGERVRAELVDSEIAKFIESIKGKTPDEVAKIIEEKAWITKEGAKYAVYKDKACTDPLMNSETNEAVVIQTGIGGMYTLTDIAEGIYYVKEVKAPVYTDGEIEIPYQVTQEPVRIDLREDADSATSNMVFRGLWDESVVYPAVEKTDIFTGDAVPNCTFEVLDSTTRKVIYHATTNDKGVAGVPIDKLEKGKEYIFREISAPDVYNENGVLYELNTDEHKFTADYEVVDGKIVFKNKLHIDNYRPTSTLKLIKVDAESGELIPNCEFELRSKEKEDFVLTGVTDEHGEYIFEDVPYGEYTFIETEAPEEYMIDTTPHDVTVDSETMDIRVPNTLKPDSPNTGDINVVALSLMAVASMLVISYVIVKNRKVRE